jgi:hypothetical protein
MVSLALVHNQAHAAAVASAAPSVAPFAVSVPAFGAFSLRLRLCCFVCRMALGSDANVHELLLSLVERLGHEQEVGWLDALTQEMVGVLDQLLGSPTVRGGQGLSGDQFVLWCG